MGRSFDIKLPLECRVLNRQGGEVLRRIRGESRTLAKKKLKFTVGSESFHHPCAVEVALDWPAVLQDGTRLRLILHGKIISQSGSLYVMDVTKWEFRVRSGAKPLTRTGGDAAG
jgi:hypothetical protein